MIKYTDAGATISPCGRYRYRLWREWRGSGQHWHMWTDNGRPVLDGAGRPVGEPKSCVFVMLNPSTADGRDDDPTIRRCVSFAQRFGYDRLDVLNLFAYRATDPRSLATADDPVGTDNIDVFEDIVTQRETLGMIVCAWGAHGGYLQQDQTALGWLEGAARERDRLPIFALGDLTKDGHPRHPLYIAGDAPLHRFDGRTSQAITRARSALRAVTP